MNGKRFRNYARNAAAYTTGYILGGHVGGFAAYKGAEYLDNSFPKMATTRQQRRRTPRGAKRYIAANKVGSGSLKRKRTRNVSKKRMGNTPRTLFKKTKIAHAPRGDMLEISGHNDMSMHKFNVSVRAPKARDKGVGRYIYHETFDGLSATLEGQQVTYICKNFMTSQQLLGLTVATDRRDKEAWACDPCALNPYQNITTVGTYTGGQTANDSFYLQSLTAQLAVVSTCTIPQKIKIMWLMYKKNSNQSVTSIWDASITYESMGQTALTYPANPTVLNPTPGTATKDFIESNPFSMKMFKQYFKLLHKEEFCLQPGDQRHFQATFGINKRFDIPYLRSMKNTSADQYLGGITIVPVIIHYGGLVQIQKSGVLDTTYGIADLGVMQNNKYIFRAVKADRLSVSRTYAGHVSAVTGDLDPISTTTTREFTVNVVDAAAPNISI